MHTRLCILLLLAGCVYAATNDTNSTSSNDPTTTTQSSATTTTAIPSTTSTTTATSTTSTTSNPSTTSTTTTPSSITSTTSTPSSTTSTTSTTSAPSSTTSTTSTPSSTTSTTSTTSSPSSTTSTTLRPPRPSGPHGPPGSPRLPGHLAHPHNLPIPKIVTQGIKVADNIARQIFGNLIPPPPSGNRGGPNSRHPRAAAFSISDPLKMMSLNGSLTVPSSSDMLKFPMPNIDEMVPDIPQSSSNYSDIDIPKISSEESLVSQFVPGVRDALDQVHEMIANELQPGADMPEAIQTAMQDILASDNPTDGLRELCSMVMNAYRIVAEHCPLFIAQKCIFAEGLRCVQNMINILEYVTSQD